MSLILALTAAAAAFTSPGQEPSDWRQIDDTDGYFTALDLNSIQGPRTARTARTVSVSADPTELTGYVILSLVVDCEAQTLGAYHAAFFDADGQMVMDGEAPVEPEPVSEEGGTLTLARAVCDGEAPASPGFGSAQAYARSILGPAES